MKNHLLINVLKLRILLCLILMFLVGHFNSFSKIIRLPYLQAVTHNEALILVESTDTNFITVNYYAEGHRTTSLATTSYIIETGDNASNPKTYVHRIKLENLSPSKKYHYLINPQEEAVKGLNNIFDKYSFTTAKKTGESFTFTVMGDSRSGPKIFDKITSRMASHNPDFSLYLGDLAYKKDYNYWEDEFFITNNEKFITNVPFYNAVGNHEGWNQNTKAFTDAPNSDISKHKAYYSFDWGDVHFLILSTEHKISENSEQYKFAVEDLKKSKAKFKIVAFHIPAYSVGAHGENKNMKDFTAKVLDKMNVTMVLTGHSHYYQHNKINGLSHFVLGGGGSPLYKPESKDYTIKSEKKYHYAAFDVTPEMIKMTVIDKDGNILDELKFK